MKKPLINVPKNGAKISNKTIINKTSSINAKPYLKC